MWHNGAQIWLLVVVGTNALALGCSRNSCMHVRTHARAGTYARKPSPPHTRTHSPPTRPPRTRTLPHDTPPPTPDKHASMHRNTRMHPRARMLHFVTLTPHVLRLNWALWPNGARRAPLPIGPGPADPAGPEGPRRPMGPEGPHGGVGRGWGGVGGWGGGVGPSPTGRGAGPESSSLNTAVERPACCQNLGGEKLFRVDGMPAYAD